MLECANVQILYTKPESLHRLLQRCIHVNTNWRCSRYKKHIGRVLGSDILQLEIQFINLFTTFIDLHVVEPRHELQPCTQALPSPARGKSLGMRLIELLRWEFLLLSKWLKVLIYAFKNNKKKINDKLWKVRVSTCTYHRVVFWPSSETSVPMPHTRQVHSDI